MERERERERRSHCKESKGTGPLMTTGPPTWPVHDLGTKSSIGNTSDTISPSLINRIDRRFDFLISAAPGRDLHNMGDNVRNAPGGSGKKTGRKSLRKVLEQVTNFPQRTDSVGHFQCCVILKF